MLMNMKDLLAVARANNFAVPAFNISSNMLLKGVMEASEEAQSPVILAIHPDELSFVTPEFVAYAVEAANKATVPVCIHLDHGANLGQVMEAIKCGFTSVMIDASKPTRGPDITVGVVTKETTSVARGEDTPPVYGVIQTTTRASVTPRSACTRNRIASRSMRASGSPIGTRATARTCSSVMVEVPSTWTASTARTSEK